MQKYLCQTISHALIYVLFKCPFQLRKHPVFYNFFLLISIFIFGFLLVWNSWFIQTWQFFLHLNAWKNQYGVHNKSQVLISSVKNNNKTNLTRWTLAYYELKIFKTRTFNFLVIRHEISYKCHVRWIPIFFFYQWRTSMIPLRKFSVKNSES